MQLGYTIPLQRFLHIQAPPYGSACDPRFCWDLHLLKPGGFPSLFAVHTTSRYAFLLHNLDQSDWEHLPILFLEELRNCLLEEGFRQADVEWYFALAGNTEVTRTHGRRPVAFLNRAVEDLFTLPIGFEADTRSQPQICLFLNGLECRAAGHESLGTARTFLKRDILDVLKGIKKEEM